MAGNQTIIKELYDATVLKAVAKELIAQGVMDPDVHYVKELTPQRTGYGWLVTLAPRGLRTPPAI
jgi:hypothetical protein